MTKRTKLPPVSNTGFRRTRGGFAQSAPARTGGTADADPRVSAMRGRTRPPPISNTGLRSTRGGVGACDAIAVPDAPAQARYDALARKTACLGDNVEHARRNLDAAHAVSGDKK